MTFDKLASEEVLDKTIKALKTNGIDVIVVKNGEDAKNKVLELIPKDSEVFTVTSTTVNSIGLAKELNESGQYTSVRQKLNDMDRQKQGQEMNKMGAAPGWVVGSVHAVTEDGRVIVVSASGSQIPAYVYGAQHVVWVVGTQKIVKSLDEGFKRVYDYVFPLENERAKKVYGMGSSVNKMMVLNKERPGRITLIFVKEVLGF